MHNVIALSKSTATHATARISLTDLERALVFYQVIDPCPSRLQRLLNVLRQGTDLEAASLRMTVPLDVVPLVENLSPKDVGAAAAILSYMHNMRLDVHAAFETWRMNAG